MNACILTKIINLLVVGQTSLGFPIFKELCLEIRHKTGNK